MLQQLAQDFGLVPKSSSPTVRASLMVAAGLALTTIGAIQLYTQYANRKR